MNSDSLQQQVALVVACQLRGQCPSPKVQRPNQSVCPNSKQKDHVVVHRHQDANVPECPNWNANCLSRETVSPTSDTGIAEIVLQMH